MKKLLTSALLIISLSCFGQQSKRDTVKCFIVVMDTATSRSFTMLGYAVRIVSNTNITEVEYLNNLKQPFLKKYRVWARN